MKEFIKFKIIKIIKKKMTIYLDYKKSFIQNYLIKMKIFLNKNQRLY